MKLDHSTFEDARRLENGHAANCTTAGAGFVTLARGATLFFAGDRAVYYYEVLHGTMRACRYTPDGHRQILRFAYEGELVGICGDPICAYDAEAATDVVLRRHNLADLDSAMMRDDALRRRILQALRDEIEAARVQAALLGGAAADEKIASFLLALAERAQTDSWTDLPVPRSDIADYLGMTVETISRKLRELRSDGLIRMQTPTRYRILDRGAMLALAASV